MEALSLMLYNLCFEQSLKGGEGGLDTFAYCLKLAGEEFKSPKMMLPPSPPLRIAAFIHRQHLLQHHELHDRVSQTSEHRKCHFTLKYCLKALEKKILLSRGSELGTELSLA